LTKCLARIDLKRYPLIVESAAHIQGSAVLDAEVVWLDSDGIAQFDALHSRVNDGTAIALAFDLLMHNDCFKEARRAVQVGAIKGVAEHQKSGGARRYSRY
jgi:ATP-dependent DNA ligase